MTHTDDVQLPELPDGVSLVEGEGGLPAVAVHTDSVVAQVYLQGAHVTSWRPAGAAEVLWLSPTSSFAPGKAIRGGVPLCAPWFGPGREGDKPVAHGWFRTATWRLASARRDGGDVVLRFTLSGADAQVPDGEPADVSAEYVVRVGRELELALTITAGVDGLLMEEALHSYFAVSDVRGVRVEGLAGHRYTDKVSDSQEVQSGDLRLAGRTDRVYDHSRVATVVDEGSGRRIVVAKEGSDSTVVWNPWEAKAAESADIGDAWPGFVCVEVANALDHYVVLGPEMPHTMVATVRVESL